MQCHNWCEAQLLGFANSLDNQLTFLVERFVWLLLLVFQMAIHYDCSLGYRHTQNGDELLRDD
jgi:hypothetical protein